MNADLNDKMTRLIHVLKLQDIKPMLLISKNVGPMPPQGSGIKLEWKQSFADGDPLTASFDTRIFRLKYEFTASFDTTPIFQQESVFIISFAVTNMNVFEELWAHDELRKVFMEKQIQKTLWPLFRQHVHDGMSRLGISPIPLPWLM